MDIQVKINGKLVKSSVDADLILLDYLRDNGCLSVKRGCETSNCGLCTVIMDGKPVLSCSILAVRADGSEIYTLEGLQKEAEEFGTFVANQGAEQCGFCNPGFIMNVIAMLRENENPSDDEIKEYLAGNLCRCSGYEGQFRAIKNFLAQRGAK
ncbi:(2Fe-2S)-binding protein [Tyzzerella sp. An114]|uniref:(2Fe-2S)-binding protein n=1 Tax=Tyzzerella sp. An114 TaxID=1965545 RepID=UPI000B4379EB|nr:(2Fe-2S)-binding protein [Tyzzerella sp. An114]OUQ59511.1 (2Fe-2S)-binding protein [Tyzzerella sp. An114]HIT72694.1 (2Fe-2S)-binding protein [Candidatus Fimicola cottocaccae]